MVKGRSAKTTRVTATLPLVCQRDMSWSGLTRTDADVMKFILSVLKTDDLIVFSTKAGVRSPNIALTTASN